MPATDRAADILVAGGGVAGLTAGLFAARNGRKTTVLTGDMLGGHLVTIATIEDFPGFPDGVAGYDLCPMIAEQAEPAGASFAATALRRLSRDDDGWRVTTSDGDMTARAVILATGSELRRLNVPGEHELRGHGVSECATCDGPLHRGKVVAVVGGGDSALLEALELTKYAAKVLVFARGPALDGQQAYAQRVLDHQGIEVRFNAEVEEITGDGVVDGVRARMPGGVSHEPVTGVFVYVGLTPRTAAVADLLVLDEDGRIPVDLGLRTNLPGLLAAGDVRRGFSGQAVSAAGDGATAAMTAQRYLSDKQWPAG